MQRRWFVGRSLLGLVTLPWLTVANSGCEESQQEGDGQDGLPEQSDVPKDSPQSSQGPKASSNPDNPDVSEQKPNPDPDATPKDGGPGPKDPQPDDGADGCEDPFEGGELLGLVGFVRESGTLGKKIKSGHDARLRFDLTKLKEDSMICPSGVHFVRTEYPNKLDENKTWKIRVHGKVQQEIELSMDDLRDMPQVSQVVCLECSGNGKPSRFGLLSAAKWTGVPFAEILKRVELKDDATSVLIGGFDERTQSSTHSTPGASWVFTLKQLADAGAFLAMEMNDEPLPKDHGKPVRLMVPGWYGCTCAKWLDEIRFVGDDEPSTPQMREFASRTLQRGVPKLAKDFRPATVDQAAMPVRVEQWRVNGEILYKVVGVMWGGYETTDALTIKLGSSPAVAVDVCPKQSQNRTWTLWSHAWKPDKAGSYAIRMAISDSKIPTRRLDRGDYVRTVQISQV